MLKNFVNYFQHLQESWAHGWEYCTADHNDHVTRRHKNGSVDAYLSICNNDEKIFTNGFPQLIKIRNQVFNLKISIRGIKTEMHEDRSR